MFHNVHIVPLDSPGRYSVYNISARKPTTLGWWDEWRQF